MKRPWLYYISPLALLALASAIFLAIGLAEMNRHKSNSIIEIFVFAIAILLLLGVDYFIKTLTKGKILFIWIIEAAIIVSLYFLLINSGNFRLSGC